MIPSICASDTGEFGEALARAKRVANTAVDFQNMSCQGGWFPAMGSVCPMIKRKGEMFRAAPDFISNMV